MSVHEQVDRSECPAEQHDTKWDYLHRGCRCPDRRHEVLRYRKLRKAGLHGLAYYPSYLVARRLQALAAIGWDALTLARRLHIDEAYVKKMRLPLYDSVTSHAAEPVFALYEELCGTPGPSERMRTYARKVKWFPPLAWDDIDNLLEKPSRGPTKKGQRPTDSARIIRAMHGEQVALTPEERTLAAVRLRDEGVALAEIARRLRISERSVPRALVRAKVVEIEQEDQ